MRRFGGLLILAALLLASCGSSGGSSVQAGTEAGLLSYLDDVKRALINADFEAIQTLQGPDCDFSVDQVAEGFQAAQGLMLAFTGSSFSDIVKDTTFEVTAFDDGTLTGTVVSKYTGDLEGFDDEEEPTQYRFVDGHWSSGDAECIGEAAEGFGGSNDDPIELGDGELRPADEVSAERDREQSLDLAIGESVTLDDGVVVTIRSIELDSDFVAGESYQSTHIVDVRAENPTTADSNTPDITIYCAGISDGGTWYADSTFDLYGDLPAGSFTEGELNLAVPEDDNGVAITPCNDPVVRVSEFFGISFGDDGPTTADYPAPPLS